MTATIPSAEPQTASIGGDPATLREIENRVLWLSTAYPIRTAIDALDDETLIRAIRNLGAHDLEVSFAVYEQISAALGAREFGFPAAGIKLEMMVVRTQ